MGPGTNYVTRESYLVLAEWRKNDLSNLLGFDLNNSADTSGETEGNNNKTDEVKDKGILFNIK